MIYPRNPHTPRACIGRRIQTVTGVNCVGCQHQRLHARLCKRPGKQGARIAVLTRSKWNALLQREEPRPSSSSPKQDKTFPSWGGEGPQDPPSSRLLSQPPQARFERLSQVGCCRGLQGWEVLGLGPGQGLAGRPWSSPYFCFLTKKRKAVSFSIFES